MSSVRVTVSQKKRKQARENREKKFLENHELQAALDVLSRRENDLSLFLAFSGLRIGEVSTLFEEDFDGEWIDISKSLQYHDLKADEFYIDTTKTGASERELQLPKVAIGALNRAIERSRKIDEHFAKNPSASYRKSKSIFRTSFGTPITSQNFRQLLGRVEKELIETCEKRYGFKWKKHFHTSWLST